MIKAIATKDLTEEDLPPPNAKWFFFFEQRRWRHFDEYPDEDAMAYIHQIIESIRTKIQSKQYD